MGDGVVRGVEVGQHTEKLDWIPPQLYLDCPIFFPLQ